MQVDSVNIASKRRELRFKPRHCGFRVFAFKYSFTQAAGFGGFVVVVSFLFFVLNIPDIYEALRTKEQTETNRDSLEKSK